MVELSGSVHDSPTATPDFHILEFPYEPDIGIPRTILVVGK